MDEQQAIQQLKNGDLRGLEALVRLHQLKAVRSAYLITRDKQSAEDVVQDLFLKLPHSIKTFQTERPFEPWFMRSVVRAAVKVARKEASKQTLDENLFAGQLLSQEYTHIPSPENSVEQAQLQDIVQQALERLSPRQRSVIVQRYYLGMSEKEIVSELELAPGTVKWLLNAARNRLKAILERSVR